MKLTKKVSLLERKVKRLEKLLEEYDLYKKLGEYIVSNKRRSK